MIKPSLNNINKVVSDLKPGNIKAIKIGTFTPEKCDIKALAPLEQDVCEFSSTKFVETPSQNTFYNLDDMLDDVDKRYLTSTNYSLDTDLSKDSVKTLRRIQYHDVVSDILGKNAVRDDVNKMSAVAADLSFKMPQRYIPGLIQESVLKGKPNRPSVDLLQFLAEHPTKRNLVVTKEKGTEFFDKHSAYHVDKISKVTNNTEDIKNSLKDCKLNDNVLKSADYVLTDLAAHIIERKKCWGKAESELLNSLKKVDDSTSTIDIAKIHEIRGLLKTKLSTNKILSLVTKDSKDTI